MGAIVKNELISCLGAPRALGRFVERCHFSLFPGSCNYSQIASRVKEHLTIDPLGEEDGDGRGGGDVGVGELCLFFKEK